MKALVRNAPIARAEDLPIQPQTPAHSRFYQRDDSGGEVRFVLGGDWVIANARALGRVLQELMEADGIIDARQVERLDLWASLRLRALKDAGHKVELSARQEKILSFLSAKTAPPLPSGRFFLYEALVRLGHMVETGARTGFGMISLVGMTFLCFMRNIMRPRGFRFAAIIRHIDETGFRALPIVGLLAILISMVIAYQASIQLEKFGANIFTIDLTVISLLREMGVLITAIMVAGRSGSAFAAEIGVMKLREEIDALKTMGFDPVELLVLPRLLAMLLTLPLLTFLADIIGLAGGAVISITLLDIPLTQYITRVENVATPTMFFIGMVKAPVFAFIITIVGCYQGLSVRGSAESVGRLTTMAVVQSIFLVIMADALFSLLFASMGI